MRTYSSSEVQNPLRMNVYRASGVTVIVDYAHNAATYAALIATGRSLTSGRLIGVVAAPGDRQASDLATIGRICGAGLDRAIVYEQDQKRGEVPGSTAQAIADGVSETWSASDCAMCESPADAIAIVFEVRSAIRAALACAVAGDVVIIGCSSDLSDLPAALGQQTEITAHQHRRAQWWLDHHRNGRRTHLKS